MVDGSESFFGETKIPVIEMQYKRANNTEIDN